METFLIILEALCSVALIAVVLLQSGKEAGLSGALTGASESCIFHQVDCSGMDSADSGSEPGVILANKTADVCLRSFLFVHP